MKSAIAYALLLSAAIANGAQIHSESFASSGAASEASLALGAGAWTFTGAVAQVTFAATDPYAIPDAATLRPSSGAFTGNYVEAGIGVIGFRFRSGSQAPSSVYLELTGGTSVFQKVFPVKEVGEWNTYMVSLSGLSEGGWTVKRGAAADFKAALQDIRSVAISIRRSGASSTDYAIDDLFVDGLPQAAGGLTVGGNLSLAWDALQVGAPYTMQESASLNGPWKDAQTVTATSRLQQFDIPTNGTASQAFFRLRGP